jgi:hypothetical protein
VRNARTGASGGGACADGIWRAEPPEASEFLTGVASTSVTVSGDALGRGVQRNAVGRGDGANVGELGDAVALAARVAAHGLTSGVGVAAGVTVAAAVDVAMARIARSAVGWMIGVRMLEPNA